MSGRKKSPYQLFQSDVWPMGQTSDWRCGPPHLLRSPGLIKANLRVSILTLGIGSAQLYFHGAVLRTSNSFLKDPPSTREVDFGVQDW
jgi:hypothetical protein